MQVGRLLTMSTCYEADALMWAVLELSVTLGFHIMLTLSHISYQPEDSFLCN